MDDKPVISFSFGSPVPGADPAIFERYLQWRNELYCPLTNSLPEVLGVDSYQIVGEHPEYPVLGGITHYKNLQGWKTYAINTAGTDIQHELREWNRRGILDTIWTPAYALLHSFRAASVSREVGTTLMDNAPIMHLEAYGFAPEDHVKYNKWLEDFAFKVFMPLFTGFPGMKGFDYYEYTGLSRTHDTRESNYPPYLTIIYFNDIQSYAKFMKSQEQISFQKAVRTIFPHGIPCRWYIQYQLVKNWRK